MSKQTVDTFKKQFHLANGLIKKTLAGSSVRWTFNYKAEEGVKMTFEAPPDPVLGRLALLVQPFADPESPLFFEKLCEGLLASEAYEATSEQRAQLAQWAARTRRGQIEFRLNDAVLDGPALFTIYAQGGYLTERPEQRGMLQAITTSPAGPTLPRFLFFSYCLDVLAICGGLYGEFRKLEKHLNAPATLPHGMCIYCRRSDGSFTSEEHVYPESLGNAEIILPPGIVCDQCNNETLSQLDSYLVSHELVSFLRVTYLPINPKSGRYTKGTSAKVSFERIGPRGIKLSAHGLSKKQYEKMAVTDQESGTVRMNVPIQSRKPFDPIMFGRCLYKIALGAIAYHQGASACLLDTRYDAARDFIAGKRDFPNYLLLPKNGTPAGECSGTFYQFNPGTPFRIVIFGVTYCFNLEEEPKIIPPPELAEMVLCFPLFTDDEGA